MEEKLQRFQELNYEMGFMDNGLNSSEMRNLFIEREALFWELLRAMKNPTKTNKE